jgi:hypothetical protein
MSNFVLDNLPKIDTKRLLSFFKKKRAILHSLRCSCCGEFIGDEDRKSAAQLKRQMRVLKEELTKREHVE